MTNAKLRRCKIALAVTIGLFACYAVAIWTDQQLVSSQLNSVIVGALVLANLGALAALGFATQQASADEINVKLDALATAVTDVHTGAQAVKAIVEDLRRPPWDRSTMASPAVANPRLRFTPQAYKSGYRAGDGDKFDEITAGYDWNKKQLDGETSGDVTPA